MFEDWSPLQLCAALGYRIDLRHQGGGRVAYLVGTDIKTRMVTHTTACRMLKRLARIKRVADVPPAIYRRALVDGSEQPDGWFVKSLPGAKIPVDT